VVPTIPTFPVIEGTAQEYRAVLRDSQGVPIPQAALLDFRLTLTRDDGCCPPPGGTPTIINGRDDQLIIDQNDVTVHATDGTVIWAMVPADLTIGAPVRAFATHRAHFTFATVGATGTHDVRFEIERRGG
jgi:hypothetical protein